MSSIELAAAAIDALIGQGVTELVLAPGARSAALALAAERADRDNRLRLHVRIDERVAGFTALGLAKASDRAVAVVTTSGTAVANLAPAAMEARAAGVPLVLLTADRPAHLVDTGANQTADQVGALSPAAVGVVRLSSASGGRAAWVAGVQRAVLLAEGRRTRRAGPVQLNLEFNEPLVGQLPPPQTYSLAATRSGGHELVELGPGRAVVLAGDAAPAVGAEARAAAELAGAPLLAEPSSNARAGRNAIAAYREALTELGGQIEQVVVYGHPTLNRSVHTLLSREDIELVVVASGADWADPGHRAVTVADRVVLAPQEASWLASWQAFRGSDASGFTTRSIADTVLAQLGASDDLVLGASGIVRAADLSPIAERAPRVFANRGLAGIDGTIATATGLALASGKATTVLLGDLTAQHDLGALVRPPGQPWPTLRIIVADDGGGTIFRGLEVGVAEYAAAFERVFLTPQGVDLAAVASALGWRAAQVTDEAALAEALRSNAEFIVAKVQP